MRWPRQLARRVSAANPHIAIEVRLDARSFALRQIVISPAWVAAPNAAFTSRSSVLDVSVPLARRPSS